MFSEAIVRTPCRAMVNGLSSAGLGVPDYATALGQHREYTRALQACGLKVTVLPPDEAFPDSTFVEDAALLTPRCAVITRPGAVSRRQETVSMRGAVNSLYDKVEHIAAPGTLEGGDVLMVEEHFFIGLSGRTNIEGARQLIAILEEYGMTGSVIGLEEVLHLKTGVSYLENGHLLACGEFTGVRDFQQFQILEVAPDEAYAANSLWLNGAVLVPAGYPRSSAMIADAGYEVLEVDVSEFRKLDGGLSCLSLRF
ncbi:MAG: arginine deiminase family protein [Xanthomonadales bacterium]|nr:arginine deiminase family protein [Xanthomonadales bacterium]